MKVLVFSDSHGRSQPMLDLIQDEHPDAVFHLGDVARDAGPIPLAFPRLPLYQVPGNCDFSPTGLPAEGVARLAGKTLAYLHGHTRRVKTGLHEAAAYARSLRADVLLFGHTHIPLCREEEGLLLFNPGALRSGRYGLLTWTDGGTVVPELRLL